MTVFGVLDRLSARWLGSDELTRDLIAGITDLESMAMGDALREMARTLRQEGFEGVVTANDPGAALSQLRDAPGAQPFVRLLEAFLLQHGHHCPNAGEWLYPRWADVPEQVIEVLAGYLRAGEQLDLTQSRSHGRHEEALAQVAESLGPLRRAVLTRVIRKAQRLVRLRDNGKQYYMKASFALRRIYMTFGQRWTDRGWLEQPDDIFFLTVLDVARVLEGEDHGLRTVVSERRRAFSSWFDVEAPDVLGPDGEPTAAPTEVAGLSLQGIPASSGLAQGTARVIQNAAEASRLQAGDVLVTRATDPGWTALFPLLSGLVTELGGQLSHAAIVAREYGLPAVVGVSRVTRRIRDGQRVSVNGTTGTVLVLGAEDEQSESEGLSPAPRGRALPSARAEPTRVSPPGS
jgi:pyruvate,water dikinase